MKTFAWAVLYMHMKQYQKDHTILASFLLNLPFRQTRTSYLIHKHKQQQPELVVPC